MRIAFFGTPEFAVPTLEAVAKEHDVVLVVAQPDRPSGRGMKLTAPPVAIRARELALPLAQPSKIRTEEFRASIAALGIDVAVVIAYGRILPGPLLAVPAFGFINVHASVLPRWRGAAPIQRAIEAGDRETGVTIMRIDEELDHGPMMATATTPIGADERAPALSARLSRLGAEALLPVLRDLERGSAIETPQDHARATLAPKIEKQEGRVTFDLPAGRLYDRFRAFDPWPGLHLESGGEAIKLTEIAPASGSGSAGTILEQSDSGVLVACASGAIRLIEMQRPGKPKAAAAALARGLGWKIGELVP